MCSSVDPAPLKCKGGHLTVENTWDRVAVEVTHFRGLLHLTVVDCGPSRYAILRQLRSENATRMISELTLIFCNVTPMELLVDIVTAFHSRAEWGIAVRYRAAHVPSGYGLVERNHRSVKDIAARSGWDVAEAVYRYIQHNGQR